MYPHSERFVEAVRSGANRIARAQVTVGVDEFSFSAIEQDVPILGGSMTLDSSAQRRRSLSGCLIPDTEGTWTQLDQLNPFSPYRQEFRPFVGFDYGDGSEPELLPLGVFRIEETSATDDGLVTISGYDRSLVVAAAGFETPLVFLAGVTPEDAILDIVERSFPGITAGADVTYSGFTLPLTVLQEGNQGGGDPWAECVKFAANAGSECFFGPTGNLVIRPVPDPTVGLPVWTHEPGGDSILLSVLNRLSAREVFNVAVVTGEGPGVSVPVRATAEITDPQSPIYPAPAPGFGRRTKFVRSSQITTTLQAQAVADAAIRDQAGAAEKTTFSAIPNPAHEGGDVVRLKVDSMGLDVLAVLDQFNMDLILGAPSNYQTKGRRSA